MAAGQMVFSSAIAAAMLIRLQRLDDAGKASSCALRRASLSYDRFFGAAARVTLASSFPASVGAPGPRRPLGRFIIFSRPGQTGRVRAGIRQVSVGSDDWVDDRRRRRTRQRALAWSLAQFRRARRAGVPVGSAGICFPPCVPRARPLFAIPWFGLVLAKFGLDARKPRGALPQTGHCPTLLRLRRRRPRIAAISTAPFSIRSVTAASSSRASFTRLPSCAGLFGPSRSQP